jgi:hypothetical protein
METIRFTAARHSANPSPTIPLLLAFATVRRDTRVRRAPHRSRNIRGQRAGTTPDSASTPDGFSPDGDRLPSRSGRDSI